MKKEMILNWIAGVVDVECYLNLRQYLHKGKPIYKPELRLTQKTKKAPLIFKAVLGGQVYGLKRKNQENMYQYYLQGKQLAIQLERIAPYLILKKKVALELIEYIKESQALRSKYPRGFPPEVIARRQVLVDELRAFIVPHRKRNQGDNKG
jgi:hypothetical protein